MSYLLSLLIQLAAVSAIVWLVLVFAKNRNRYPDDVLQVLNRLQEEVAEQRELILKTLTDRIARAAIEIRQLNTSHYEQLRSELVSQLVGQPESLGKHLSQSQTEVLRRIQEITGQIASLGHRSERMSELLLDSFSRKIEPLAVRLDEMQRMVVRGVGDPVFQETAAQQLSRLVAQLTALGQTITEINQILQTDRAREEFALIREELRSIEGQLAHLSTQLRSTSAAKHELPDYGEVRIPNAIPMPPRART